MFTHAQLWAAIDAIAEARGAIGFHSGEKAGLDTSALNLSKRVSPDGHMRWPSTESLSRILAAADMDLRALADIVDALARESR